MFDPRIHWLALINSVVIVSFLCMMVGIIVARSISRDIHRYNAIDMTEDVQEDFGWKLVHGEVFRPPNRPMFLSIFVGSGSQLVAMAAVMAVSEIGFLGCCYLAARRVLPAVHVVPRYVTSSVLRELLVFAGSYQLVNILEVVYTAVLPLSVLTMRAAKAALIGLQWRHRRGAGGV